MNQNSNASNSIPEIGMGATIQHYSDRSACTIIHVSPSKKTIILQRDNATRIDNNGMSESQEYVYSRNHDGERYQATLRKDGRYRLSGAKTGETVYLNIRDEYYDFSF